MYAAAPTHPVRRTFDSPTVPFLTLVNPASFNLSAIEADELVVTGIPFLGNLVTVTEPPLTCWSFGTVKKKLFEKKLSFLPMLTSIVHTNPSSVGVTRA